MGALNSPSRELATKQVSEGVKDGHAPLALLRRHELVAALLVAPQHLGDLLLGSSVRS